MIKVLAIDDEPLALQQLVAYIGKVPFLHLAGQCQSALEAMEILDREPVDAIFCDINMPDLSGMEFVKSLTVPPLVVFTTAYSEYAVEGFKVDAVDYLLKPFGLQDFMRAANRVKERLEIRGTTHETLETLETGDDIFVKTDYRVVKVAIHDIRYVEALLAMKTLEERLPQNFMRIHRSYIVNLDKIQEVNKNRVILDADTYLPIGDSYREAFNRYIEAKFLGR